MHAAAFYSFFFFNLEALLLVFVFILNPLWFELGFQAWGMVSRQGSGWYCWDVMLSLCVSPMCHRVVFRDVSSVEVLMNYHQSLRNEVDARSQSVMECIDMGKMLLAARNPAAHQVTLLICE